ncbi:MAG TPA: hypothetical protein VGY66_22045 [Gemmataceae bacterium]|jgi:hypothetical protein|nr:hypothetical protein [Gemmataceae bacterium]
MAAEPEITLEQLAIFRRCRFVRRVFASYPSLLAKKPMEGEGEWHISMPYTGEPFDPEEFELREGGWDHEHCDVCWAEVLDGMSYWPNVDPDGGHVDLCETCYPRVMALLEYEEDTSMASFVIRLDPRRLDNPDADIRYRLPDLLAQRSGGVISEDGFDYIGEGPLLVLFLKASALGPALECVLDVVENVRVLGNDLRPAAVVAVERKGEHEVVYPADFEGPFLSGPQSPPNRNHGRS